MIKIGKTLDNLKEGTFIVKEGVVCNIMPLTDISTVEEQIRKEIKLEISQEMKSNFHLIELARGMEFITENGWKVSFDDNKDFSVCVPLKGNIITYKSGEKVINTYIPKSWLCFCVYKEFYGNNNDEKILITVKLIPNIKGKTIKECMNMVGDINLIHPHMYRDGNICIGNTPIPEKFKIDIFVSFIKSFIEGTEKGTSFFDYNQQSPVTRIEGCKVGHIFYDMHKNNKDDEYIWNELKDIIKALDGEPEMDDDFEDEDDDFEDEGGNDGED